MSRRPLAPIFLIVIAMILTLPMTAQQKPFTQEQVSNMARDGFEDDSGAKLIERRGIDFTPTDEFLQPSSKQVAQPRSVSHEQTTSHGFEH